MKRIISQQQKQRAARNATRKTRYAKLVFISLLLLSVVFISVTAGAQATEFNGLAVNPYGGDAADIDTVSWFASAGRYFLFLPADTDPALAKVYFDGAESVALDGERIISGETASVFTVGEHTLAVGDKTYPLTVCVSAEIPAVFIATQSGSLSYIHANKENKEPADIRIWENGEMTLDKPLRQIKGRGNASWTFPKKPYNIKFDKKTDLFGMGKAKKWTLLANYADESLLRNVYGWEYGKATGLDYNSEYRHVDLYINGEYLGNYVICESVEIGAERINIRDLEAANEDANPSIDLEALPRAGTGAGGAIEPGTAAGSAKWVEMPSSPDDVSGGYLLELELAYRYDAEPCGFVADCGQPVVIKSPELASAPEVKYIQALVNDAMNALYAPSGYNEKGTHYSEYFDMDSLVNMYIVQELSANLDAGVTSTFLYKSQDSDKLVFSPVWDFDHAFGDEVIRFGVNNGDPDIWWANSISYPHVLVFNAAYRHDDFRAAVRERWEELVAGNVVSDTVTAVHALSETLSASGKMNILRWNASAADPAAAAGTYAAKVDTGERFISRRTGTLSKGFSENGAMLYYDANGGLGNIFNPYVALKGESVTVIDRFRGENNITAPAGDHLFMGWNTAPDGSGAAYQPGDTIVLNDTTTTLYAVWKTQSEIDGAEDADHAPDPGSGAMSFWQRIVAFFNRIIEFFRNLFGVS